MAVTFRILPRHTLVYLRFEGFARVGETTRAMAACAIHPDFDPSYRHLMDLSRISDFETDYPGLMALQARAADWFAPAGNQPFLIYLAPTPRAQSMARLVMRSWEGIGQAVVVLLGDDQAVLDFLGLRAASVEALLAQPDRLA